MVEAATAAEGVLVLEGIVVVVVVVVEVAPPIFGLWVPVCC